MKFAKLLCVSAFICIFSTLILAQAGPNLENGFKNYGSYDGSHLDTVNLMNGNLMLHIPVLPAFAERGEFAPQYSLYVTSKSWQVHCKSNPPYGEICWWDSNNPGVMLISAEGLMASRTLVKDFSGDGTIFYTTQGYSVTGPDGSVHQFAPVSGQPQDAYSNDTVFESLDTSGYHLVVSNPDLNGVMNNVMVIDRKGIKYPGVFSTYADFKSCYHPGTNAISTPSNYQPVIDDAPFGEGFCKQVAFARQATDPNGNQMNFVRTTLLPTTPPALTTDTLNRSMPFSFIPANTGTADVSKCVSVSGRPINDSNLIYYNAPDGTTQFIQRCYSLTPIQTAFNQPSIVEAPNGNTTAPLTQLRQLVTVVLADGSNWVFDYNNYGDVIYVGLPAGGNISYEWTQITVPPSSDGLTRVSRAIKTRVLTDNNGHTSKWSYNWGTPGTTLTNTVTDPLLNDTVHVFTVLDGIASLYETSTQYFDGAKGGQPLKQVDTAYSPNTILTDDGLAGNVVPASIKTTLNPSGKVNLVAKQYDGGLGPGSSIFGNVVKEFEYDWGQGSPGALLRETDTTYQWQIDSRYQDAHLVDLPSSVVIKDGSGCALSETDYTDDEPPYLTGTTVATQHVAAPNPAPVRGNQTTVTRWLAPASACNPKSGTAVTSHTNWYDTGEPYQKIDPLGHTSTLSYDSAYASAYVTQTCSPQTGSVTHCVSGTYDFNTGVLTSLTNENATAQAVGNTPGDQAHTSNFAYDSTFRITSAQAPPDPANGGVRAQTSFTFSPPNVFPLSVQRTKSITTALSDSASNVFDGLGRAVQGQHVLPGGTAIVNTTFDLAGRPSTVSNPYFSTSDPTYGIATNQYDALDRVTQTTKQDGSIRTVNYDQAAPGVSGVCTVSKDEAGKQRRGCSDALGRLVEVDEPNPGSQPIPAQGTLSINGILQSQAGVGAYGSAIATAQVTIGGSDRTHSVIPTCTTQQIRSGTCDQIPEWFNDTGAVHITINGHEYDYQFGQGDGPDIASTVASGLVSQIQADASRVVNASISSSAQNVVVLTALGAGAAGNSIAVSTGSTLDFTTSPASGNLAGGLDFYPGVTVYDKGTVSLTVGGFTAQACYGRSADCVAPPAGCAMGDSTSAQVACVLASGLNASGSPVSASSSGSSITLTYQTAGAAGNGVSLTSSSQSTQTQWAFSPPSFSSAGTTLANGLNAGDVSNNPLVTLYQYDALGNLLRVDQKGTAPNDSTQWRTRTFTYDSFSRLLAATNPESGTITYSYDLDGNLLQKTSPAPNQTGTATQTVSYCYDELHRVTGKGYGAQSCPLSAPAVSYTYDSGTNAIGKLTSLTDQAGTASYTYALWEGWRGRRAR
jgi:YD repeat-containing protein